MVCKCLEAVLLEECIYIELYEVVSAVVVMVVLASFY